MGVLPDEFGAAPFDESPPEITPKYGRLSVPILKKVGSWGGNTTPFLSLGKSGTSFNLVIDEINLGWVVWGLRLL